MANIRLSKSTLDELTRCPRCWWLAKNKSMKAPDGRHVPFKWHAQVITIKADHARIKDLVTRAGQCLEGPCPKHNDQCDMCEYVALRAEYSAVPAQRFPPTYQK